MQRLVQEKLVLDAFWSSLETESLKVLLKSKLGEAFHYAANQKEGLMNYLANGICILSNNLSQNNIRPFTIEMNNRLFHGTACVEIYSSIETAKANNLKYRKYNQFILTCLICMVFQVHPEYFERYLSWDPVVQEKCVSKVNVN